MTETANLGMPFIEGSQAQKHITHNEALRILDAAVQIGVLDTALTEPPPSPVEGARYIVAAGASGDWTGNDNAIAAYEDATWRFLMPKLGWSAWSAADEVIFVFDGAAWRDLRDLPVAIDSTASVGINASASDPNLLTVHSNAALIYAIDATSGGSGDARLQISKESSANTASMVFSDNFSGHAEFGLIESNAFKLKVSDNGASFVEALTIDQASGNLAMPRGLALTGVLAPPQLGTDENDYAPAGGATVAVIRLSADAVRGITGFAEGSEGRVLCIVNVGAFAIILRNENTASSAANRFGFGVDLTLAPSQGAMLIYDAAASRWRQIGGPSASGGGGGTGATDSERRNALLALAYQSKSFAQYRRLVNVFATGFKGADDTANGIDAGASTNYTVDAANGLLKPTSTGGLVPSGTGSLITDMTVRTTAIFDGAANQASSASAQKASTTSFYAGKTYSGGKAVDRVIVYGTNNVGFSASVSPSMTINLRGKNGSAPSSASDGTLLGTLTFTNTSNESSGRVVSSSDTTMLYDHIFVEVMQSGGANTMAVAEVEICEPAVASNMTAVTAAQTTDSSVSYARVLLEYDNVETPALNTDLTVEVTCDGGSNWTSATLSAVTSNGQGGRKVVETDDTACTPGASFAARIKTLNNKHVPVHGVTLSVH